MIYRHQNFKTLNSTKYLVGCFFVLLCFGGLSAQSSSTIADSNNKFAFKLYDEVKKDTKENLFFSPFSISTALAMTYGGARGETEKQMSRTLHFSLDQASFHQEYKSYLENIESDTGKGMILGIANSLWISNKFKLLNNFKEITTNDYKSEARNVSFSDETRKEINQWVEQKTNDKIKDLIAPGVINSATRLVLVNAIYFNGKWNEKFSKDSTKNQDFYLNPATVKIDFMHNTAHYKYYEDSAMQAIELSYTGKKTSMIVFLKKDYRTNKEYNLDYSYYSKIVSSMSPERVKLALPKFKTTVSFELSKTLSSMGMPDAFGAADFKGISNENLSISNVIHKAFIDVSEEGTEAAAATAIVMRANALGPRPKSFAFIANHPFMFVIRDNATGAILFMGEITNPSKE
jgi:serpin B